MTRAFFAGVLLACAVLAGPGPVAAATIRYDVSYLWHGDFDSVVQYRSRVAQVLGPQVARKLKIARKPGLYGLIYHRNGDGNGAVKVARAHTRLLRSRGLEPAAAVRSRNWDFVGAAVRPAQAVNAPVSRPASRSEFRNGAAVRPAQAVNAPVSRPASRSEFRNLEAAVNDYIQQLRRKGLVSRDERTAWSVYDFTTGEKLVGINEDVQFQAASLVKPFFAMAYFHKVALGELRYGSTGRRHMERMIQHSNNASTNWVVRQVGGPQAVQRLLKQNYPSIFRDTYIVEYIPAGGRTYRNKASAHDYSRFLHALWKETIPGAGEIKRLMALPGPDRIYTGASAIPKGTRVYNKTGSTARLCGDMGILVVRGNDGRRYAYTLVGVIEKQGRARNYGRWIRSRGNVIRRVSNLVYQGITEHHGLRS